MTRQGARPKAGEALILPIPPVRVKGGGYAKLSVHFARR